MQNPLPNHMLWLGAQPLRDAGGIRNWLSRTDSAVSSVCGGPLVAGIGGYASGCCCFFYAGDELGRRAIPGPSFGQVRVKEDCAADFCWQVPGCPAQLCHVAQLAIELSPQLSFELTSAGEADLVLAAQLGNALGSSVLSGGNTRSG
ncbi:hypothetical protein ACIODS_27605 [Micromonospora chalcea]|uniref:hypothetical protein n=1 Tax=Micromonospora chalcea TaxID=1874 RepID=UPI00382FD722